MGRRKKGEPPAYRLHKASGQAYVTHDDGQREYLGIYGSRDSHDRYQAIRQDWLDRHFQSPSTPRPTKGGTVNEIVAAWVAAEKSRYSQREQEEFRHSCRPLLQLYGDHPAAAIRQQQIRDVRAVWIEKRYARQTVNARTSRIKLIWRWALSEGLLEPDEAATVLAVRNLREGEHGLPEYQEVHPVALRDFVAVLRVAVPRLADMLRCLYRIGCRPGELCRMIGAEIDRSGTVVIGGRTIRLPVVQTRRGPVQCWAWKPSQHKGKHRQGRARNLIYVLGPRVQAILVRYLRDDPQEPLWQPREILEDQRSLKRGGRPLAARYLSKRKKNPQKVPACAQYTTQNLDAKIAQLCKKAGAAHWSANQLRHNYVSRVDQTFGLQAASDAVGHTQLKTTSIYIEKNLRRATEVAARLG